MKRTPIVTTRIRSPQVKTQVAWRSIGSAKICVARRRAAAAPSVTATAVPSGGRLGAPPSPEKSTTML